MGIGFIIMRLFDIVFVYEKLNVCGHVHLAQPTLYATMNNFCYGNLSSDFLDGDHHFDRSNAWF